MRPLAGLPAGALTIDAGVGVRVRVRVRVRVEVGVRCVLGQG